MLHIGSHVDLRCCCATRHAAETLSPRGRTRCARFHSSQSRYTARTVACGFCTNAPPPHAHIRRRQHTEMSTSATKCVFVVVVVPKRRRRPSVRVNRCVCVCASVHKPSHAESDITIHTHTHTLIHLVNVRKVCRKRLVVRKCYTKHWFHAMTIG